MEEKLGLALSGGGFRAAYFHIGVLARLAEQGVLQEISAISTVSGGSIVGVLYYLHVKNLFEARPRTEIQRSDYVAIVEDIAEHFDRAVRRNLRARVFLNPFKNIAMCWPGYSRSDRIGALYESWFYARPWSGGGPFEEMLDPALLAARTRPIRMRDLKIQPHGHDGAFDPDVDNEAGAPQVPILLVNATTLNTGHNWRFEAMYMGELNVHEAAGANEGTHKEDTHAFDPVRADIDKNTTLARTSYAQMAKRGSEQRLGTAVAASSGFPGLFKPYEIPRLFGLEESPRKWNTLTVRLMDGGIHDNQGIEALLDRGCTELVISDASGQMKDIVRPVPRLPSVLGRSSSIARDRLRELQTSAAMAGRQVVFLHLEKGVTPMLLRPRESDGSVPPAVLAPHNSTPALFGVHEGVQRLLAQLRTDLDAFSSIESKSLMNDGYAMASAFLTADEHHHAGSWRFTDIDSAMKQKPDGRYGRQLAAGAQTFLKSVYLFAPAVAPAVLLILVALGAWLGIERLADANAHINAAWVPVGVIAVALAAAAYARPDVAVLGWLGFVFFEVFVPLIVGVVSLVLWPVAAPLSWLGNQLFLWRGRDP